MTAADLSRLVGVSPQTITVRILMGRIKAEKRPVAPGSTKMVWDISLEEARRVLASYGKEGPDGANPLA